MNKMKTQIVRRARALTRPILAPARRQWQKYWDARIYAATGLVSTAQCMEGDIYIAGYPKSGNTWMQYLVSGLYYGANPQFVPDALVEELVPYHDGHRYYRRFSDPMFFKTHGLPVPQYRRVIYLLRDGRDAMVSYFHHLSALKGREIDFLHAIETGEELFPSKWHEHVDAWQANPYGAEMIFMRYEDLKKDTVTELLRLCDFADISRDRAFLETVVQQASFENMRQKEKETGWSNPAWPKDKPFVRRGQVGSYRDEMSPDVLEAFLKDAGDTLRRLGYTHGDK